MHRKIIALLFVLLAAASLHAQPVTENFESYLGAGYFIKTAPSFTVRRPPLTVEPGQIITNGLAPGSVYASAGQYVDGQGAVQNICDHCTNYIQIRFDQKVSSLDFQIIHPAIEPFLNRTMWYRIYNLDDRRLFMHVPFGPGEARTIIPPWTNYSGVEIIADGLPIGDFAVLHMFGIDNVSYTMAPPVRVASGAGVGPAVAATDRKLVGGSGQIGAHHPLGLPFFLQLEQRRPDGTWAPISSTFTIHETPITTPQQVKERLFPTHHLWGYGSPGALDFKNFQSVHLGEASVRILPTNRDIDPVDVKINIFRPSSLGGPSAEGSIFDAKITDVADDVGIPPQYIKAQIEQESNFRPRTFRYEAITVDYRVAHSGNISTGFYIARSPWNNYILLDGARPEGSQLCPAAPFTIGQAFHDCRFPELNDLQPRMEGPPYLNIEPTVCAQKRRLTAEDGRTTPVTIRQLYNGSHNHYHFDGADPSPEYGPTRKCETTSSGRKRRACCTSPDKLAITAQTPIASSYGLMQVVHAFFIDGPVSWKGKAVAGTSNRYNPELLMDDRNSNVGSLFLGASLDAIRFRTRNQRDRDNVTWTDHAQFEEALRQMFIGYNGRTAYGQEVLNRVKKFMPMSGFKTFPDSGSGCGPEIIESISNDASVLVGNSVNLGVKIDRNVGVFGYQWYEGFSGDVSRPVARGDWKYVTVKPTGTTHYWVLIRTDCGTVRSGTVTVATRSFCSLPAITAQPQDQRIDAGDSTTLSVTAARETSHRWFIGRGPGVEYADGDRSNPIPNSNSASISVTPTRTTDYWVQVTNSCGHVFSRTVRVTVVPCNSPRIDEISQSHSIDEGAGTTLFVAANGTATLSYQWYIGDKGAIGTPVPNGATASIPVSPGATTKYWVRITNKCGVRDSDTITITVIPRCVAPAMATPPQGASIVEGESATLAAAASGTAPLTYSWFTQAGLAVGTGASINVSPNVTTSYFVRASNACGSVDSGVVTVTVAPACHAPAIGAQPQSTSITAGGSASLSVTATGTAPLNHQWYTSAGAPAGTGASISVTPSVTTSYYAVISNSCGSVTSATATVTVTAACNAPAITSQPQNASINAGGSAPLSVSANGTAPLTYRWYTSAGTAVGTGASISVTPSQTTVYYVVVSNLCGTVVSTTATVTVNTTCNAPAIAAHPQSTTIAAGSSAVLTVAASGTAPLTHQWFTSGGTAVGTGTSITVSPSATTSYFVRVSNSCGSIDSAAAVVTVSAACNAPAITSQPQSISIGAGSSATLTVAASGTAPLGYQWYTSAGTPIGTTASLTVSPAQTTSYYVAVSNSCGTVTSATATVTVCNAPAITSQPQSTSIATGSSATLAVTASGTGPLSYQWFTSAGTPVGNNASLTVSPAQTSSYYVVVTNACGTATSSMATVTICNAPAITSQPQSTSIATGSSATLTVTASGSSPLSYQWYTSTGTPVGSNASLTVSPAQTTSYHVVVANACGTVTSATATVTVCNAPAFTSQPQSTSITAGSSATLAVAASGTGPLSYQWYTSAGTPVGNNASLTVSPAQTTAYYVVITNACGTVTSATATVTICSAPVITSHPQSTVFSPDTSATLSVTATGTAPLTYQWFTGGGAAVGTGPSITVSPSETTSYFVRVSNACGQVDSAVATVTLCHPPVITTAVPAEVTIRAGETFSIWLDAEGDSVRFRWMESTDGTHYSGVPFGATNFLQVAPSETTYYYCEAFNDCGYARTDVITVNVVP